MRAHGGTDFRCLRSQPSGVLAGVLDVGVAIAHKDSVLLTPFVDDAASALEVARRIASHRDLELLVYATDPKGIVVAGPRRLQVSTTPRGGNVFGGAALNRRTRDDLATTWEGVG